MSRADPARVRDYLGHIVEAITNIQEYTAGMNEAAYVADKKTQDAVVRNFEVIGEACNNSQASSALCKRTRRRPVERRV